ncbi:unnamed protein product [Parajaminaea phylloscopi]
MDPITGAINGITPRRMLATGEAIEINGSSNKPYIVKRLKGRDDFACSCPSYQYGAGPGSRARTCKHLREVLGPEYEAERLRTVALAPAPAKAGMTTPLAPYTATKPGPSKRLNPNEDDKDGPVAKRARRTCATPKNYDVEAALPTPSNGGAGGSGGLDLMLAHSWDLKAGLSPDGMWASEKLDGVRAHWDGARLWSRRGKEFIPPDWWKRRLPSDVQLDGELFSKRDHFDTTSGWVRAGASQNWKTISFVVFDCVDFKKPLEERWKIAKAQCADGELTVDEITAKWGSQVAFLAQKKVESHEHLKKMLADVEDVGGEGLMLRRPGSYYKGGRSHDLLKVKTFYDAEAVVVGYKEGEGRNKGRVGSLQLKMACGKLFDCGTGLTDSLREDPPKVGSVVVYAFQELSHEGTPRFPSYKGVAVDKTKAKDAVVRSQALRAAAAAATASSSRA